MYAGLAGVSFRHPEDPTMRCLLMQPSFVWVAPLFALVFGSSGCSSTEPSPNAGTGGGGGSSGGAAHAAGQAAGATIAYDQLHGGINIDLAPDSDTGEGYTTLIARFFDGLTPNESPLKLDSELGDCQLWVPNFPFCSESCAPAACTANDQCTDYPSPLPAGPLTVTGLGPELTLQPASTMRVYQGPSLPNPACKAGAQVTASVAGLTLEARCIPQLELTGPDPIPVMSGEPVKVSWVSTTDIGDARVRIGLDIAHHGGKKGQIDCSVPDTGSFEIPEPLVTKLVGLGLAGYPTISLTRVSVGIDSKREEVQLVMASNVVRAVDTGVISCQEEWQCPDGHKCLETRVCD